MNCLSQNSQHFTFSAQNPSVLSSCPQNTIRIAPQPGKASESLSHPLCRSRTEILLSVEGACPAPLRSSQSLLWRKVNSSLPGFSIISSFPSFRHQFKVSLEDTVTDHPGVCHTPSHGHPGLNNGHFHFTLFMFLKLVSHSGDFYGGPVVKNPPCNAGGKGLIPSWGTKIPCVSEQLEHTRVVSHS